MFKQSRYSQVFAELKRKIKAQRQFNVIISFNIFYISEIKQNKMKGPRMGYENMVFLKVTNF